MHVLFACGGTGGHINPALAVAGSLRRQDPQIRISFIGNRTGMESHLVPAAGFHFYGITVSGFQRRLSLNNLKKNVLTIGRMVSASREAKKLLKTLAPDVVVGMGGYVSGPVLREAHRQGIPTAIHEQNAYPGLTTKLLVRYVDAVMLAVPKAAEYLPHNRRYMVTGNPVRQEVLNESREAARSKLGLDDRLMILSFGGSLGARRVNESVAELIAWHAVGGRYYHYHGTGQAGEQQMVDFLDRQGIDPLHFPQLRISRYINDMAVCMAAADLVICRAGATTLSELEAKGRASVLIPSPNVAENHQYHNAMTLFENNAAIVIEEKDLTPPRLIQEVSDLLSHPEKLKTMGKAAQSLAIFDSCERIGDVIRELYACSRK